MRYSVLIGALALCASTVASAQHRPAPNSVHPSCPGNFATIRISDVKPGKWPRFARAVADHRDWYARHRAPITVTLARVLDRDGRGYSDREAVTMTVYREPDAAQPPHDAAYAAFVDAYKASSTIREERRVCLPSG